MLELALATHTGDDVAEVGNAFGLVTRSYFHCSLHEFGDRPLADRSSLSAEMS